MKNILMAIIINAVFSAAYSQQMDFSKYKLMFQGKEIHVKDLDSLQKIYGNVGISKDMSTNPPTITFIPMTAEMKAEIANSEKNGEKMWLNKPLPSFEKNDLNNHIINNAALRNKIVVINFYFTHCEPCIREMPELNKLVAEYKGKDIVFLAFALDDPKEVKEFLKKTRFDYQQIPSAKALVRDQFKINSFPTHMIVNKKGEIVFFTQGLQDNTVHRLDETLNSLTIAK